MQTKLEFKGDKALIKTLESLKRNIAKRVLKPAMSSALLPVNREAKKLCPKLTGQLKKSIGKQVGKNGQWARVYVRKGFEKGGYDPGKIAHLPEYGTKKFAPKPFMRPALANKQLEVLNILKNKTRIELNKEIEKTMRRGK